MSRIWAVAVVLSLSQIASAQEAFDLLKYLPPQANMVAVVNTQAILGSPRSLKEGWAKLEHTEYLAGAVPLNPMVERLVLAKELNPDDPANGMTIGLIPVNQPVDLAALAKKNGGTETQVAEQACTVSPTGVCYFKFGDKLLGTIRSDNKQEVSRWLKFTKTAKDSQMHRVINAAVAASKDSHITIALDADDLFHDQQIDVAVALSPAMKANPEQAKLVAKFFKGLKGVVFTANIGKDGITAKVKLESSSQDLKLEPELVRNFLIDTMARRGAELQDLGGAQATKGDSSVSFAFQISDPELSRIMSLILPAAAIPPSAEGIAVAPKAPTAERTLKYFNAVNAIIDDLQKQNAKAKDYAKTAVWNDAAANKIDGLATIGVDKDVIDYGVGTSQRLRMIGDSLNGVPAKIDDLAGQAYAVTYMPRGAFWRPRINPWAGAAMQTNVGDIANKQAQVIKDDEKNRKTIWAGIDSKRSETRAAIAQKYNVVPPEKK